MSKKAETLIDNIGRKNTGKAWYADFVKELARELEPVFEDRDRLRAALRQVMRRHHPLYGSRETWTGGLASPDDIARWLDVLADDEVRALLETRAREVWP